MHLPLGLQSQVYITGEWGWVCVNWNNECLNEAIRNSIEAPARTYHSFRLVTLTTTTPVTITFSIWPWHILAYQPHSVFTDNIFSATKNYYLGNPACAAYFLLGVPHGVIFHHFRLNSTCTDVLRFQETGHLCPGAIRSGALDGSLRY